MFMMNTLKILAFFMMVLCCMKAAVAMPMKLQEDIRALGDLRPADYIERVEHYRISIVNHLKFEREECQSKFRQPRRGTRKEKQAIAEKREQCLSLVNDWKGEYFRALAKTKKRYVAGIHQKELNMIDQAFQSESPGKGDQ